MIEKTRDELKNEILRKSPYSLPMRPSDSGLKPEEIKRFFWQWLISEEGSSLFGELDRVVDETNAEFDARMADMLGTVPHLSELVSRAAELLSEIREYDDLLPELRDLAVETEEKVEGAKEDVAEAKEALDGKLDRISETGTNPRVYGITPEGEQTVFPVSREPEEGSIAVYGPGGRLKSHTPILDDDVATKQYTDEIAFQKYGEGFLTGTDIANKIADGSIEALYLGPDCRKVTNNAFQYQKKLKTVYIDTDRLDNLSSCCFQQCTALTVFRVLRPCSITKIYNNVFDGCTSLSEIDFSKCTRVPQLTAISSFNGLPTNYVIRVPHELYTDWIAAANWQMLVSHIVPVGAHSFGEWDGDSRRCSVCGAVEMRTSEE